MEFYKNNQQLPSSISIYDSKNNSSSTLNRYITGAVFTIIGMLICAYPEFVLAAPDSLEAMGKQVNTLAGGTIKKAVVTVGTVAGMAGGFFSGNIKLALAVLAVGIIMGIALVLNENGMALTS